MFALLGDDRSQHASKPQKLGVETGEHYQRTVWGNNLDALGESEETGGASRFEVGKAWKVLDLTSCFL